MAGNQSRCLGLAPYLFYQDAGAALDWLSRVFGLSEDVRYLDPDGVVAEAEMLAGDTRIMVGGGRSAGANEGRGQRLVVFVDDVDAHHERVTSAGVAANSPENMPYGARVYEVVDPEGYRWTFWQAQGAVILDGGWRQIRS